jgi:DNA-binding beta-propeller fold protein YncE
MRSSNVRRTLRGLGGVVATALVVALTAVVPAHASGPPIKTQQCNVAPLVPGNFVLNDQLFVANRSQVVTGYQDLHATADGFLPGAPDTTISGSTTQLSLVSKNYLVGMVRDAAGRLYISGPNSNTVHVYNAPVLGQNNNTAPVESAPGLAGLSQPGGLALDEVHHLLYVANTANGRVTVYAAAPGATTFPLLASIGGLSAPLGLAINSAGTRLYVANRGINSIVVYRVAAGPVPVFTPLALSAPLQDLTGPIGLALNPTGTRLFVANNGKTAGWYSVTTYAIDASSGLPAATAAHIGGDKTGLCNPAAVAVDPSGLHLYVANRESSGGSITVYNLDPDGSLKAPADFNVQPATMMLHNAQNQLGAPVGLIVVAP